VGIFSNACWSGVNIYGIDLHICHGRGYSGFHHLWQLRNFIFFFIRPARVSQLLQNCRALTATELANVAGITRQTASSHLGKLCDAALLLVQPRGRHKHFRIANEDVADVLERLIGLAARTELGTLVTGPKDAAMRRARTCYDHLAGPLAVEFYAHAVTTGWFHQPVVSGCLSRAIDLTPVGATELSALGLPIDSLKSQKRQLCRACLDWSERRDHLAGALGAEVLRQCVDRGWATGDKDSRVVRFNASGEAEFRNLFCGVAAK